MSEKNLKNFPNCYLESRKTFLNNSRSLPNNWALSYSESMQAVNRFFSEIADNNENFMKHFETQLIELNNLYHIEYDVQVTAFKKILDCLLDEADELLNRIAVFPEHPSDMPENLFERCKQQCVLLSDEAQSKISQFYNKLTKIDKGRIEDYDELLRKFYRKLFKSNREVFYMQDEHFQNKLRNLYSSFKHNVTDIKDIRLRLNKYVFDHIHLTYNLITDKQKEWNEYCIQYERKTKMNAFQRAFSIFRKKKKVDKDYH